MAQQPEKRSSWRDPDWELQTPTTVSDLLHQNPFGARFAFVVISALATVIVGDVLADELGVYLALPLGFLVGVLAWWALMFGFAKGWVVDE